MLFDTHSHLNFNAFKNDFNEVIKKSLDENVWIINVGSQYETSKKAVEIANNYKEGVYASIGLHPIHITNRLVSAKNDKEETEFLAKCEDFDKIKYRELALSANQKTEGHEEFKQRRAKGPEEFKQRRAEGSEESKQRRAEGSEERKRRRVVAIGEIGLDYYYKPKTKAMLELFKENQKQVFLEQLDLARELDLPVIVHCRSAHNDLINILEGYKLQVTSYKLRGVIHCFTGTIEEMKQYIDLGFYIGFNGIIFKLDLDEAIKQCPAEKILIETDCPYLTPLPAVALAKAGPKEYVRNEPIFIRYVAEKIAGIKNLSFEEVFDITTKNARKLFGV